MTSIAGAIRGVLLTAEPAAKVWLARKVARDWRLGRLEHRFDAAMPDRPTQPAAPELLRANRMPRRGRGGSERGRIATLHAIAHIEYAAIDLAFDMAGRFGAQFPRDFIDDWMGVGADEAMHFALLDRRLRALGSHYGALPAHDGLWEAAAETAHDVRARLAVVPMVLEARGLDVTEDMVRRFRDSGDEASARILQRIHVDEIRHVGAGTKWFHLMCRKDDSNPVTMWKMLVNRHFGGSLKPPFNDSARTAAGLTQEYYR
jgi:uncharacterized ferritin-like protein (DUF455 family)